jgi:tRNA (guanine-N7-)-methyltransferase
MQVRFVDVGCGFGGLLIRLAPLYPDKLMLGFELRDKVSRTEVSLVVHASDGA